MKQNKPIDFDKILEDPSFIQWVQGEQNSRAQEWEYRYQHDSAAREMMDRARLVVEGIPFHQRFISPAKVNTAWNNLEAELERHSDRPSEKRGKVMNFWKYAAAVIVLITLGGGLYNFYQNREEIYYTGYGERQEFKLPDGSQVVMNANSSLRYQRRQPRQVTMTGEIYFDIARKPETGEPFKVYTPDLSIRVLGTEFNVNTRRARTDVLLEEGVIELEMDSEHRLSMRPGDFISYSSSEKRILSQRSATKPEVITSWKEGVLLLDSISLVSTLALLEETYNVTTVIESKELGDKILVGGVPNDNLEMCVRALRTIYNLEIELVSDSLIVR